MTYKYTDSTNTIVADGKGWSGLLSAPEVQAWLSEGNTPEPADVSPVYIAPISPRQIRQALTSAGLRTQVEAAVAAGDQDLKDWYEFSTTFQRSQPLVIQMGIDLGQTPTQLDTLWKLAATL